MGVKITIGSVTMVAGTDTVKEVTLPTGTTLSKSYIQATWRLEQGSSNQESHGSIDYWLYDTGSVVKAKFERAGNDSISDVIIQYTVIEDDDNKVQRNNGTNADATGNPHTLTAVVLANSFALVTAKATNSWTWNIGKYTSLRADITTTTNVQIKGNANNTNVYHWQVVENTNFTVQKKNINLPNSSVSAGGVLSPAVTMGETRLVGSATPEDAISIDAAPNVKLSSTTNIKVERLSGYQYWDFTMYAVSDSRTKVQRNDYNMGVKNTDTDASPSAFDKTKSFVTLGGASHGVSQRATSTSSSADVDTIFFTAIMNSGGSGIDLARTVNKSNNTTVSWELVEFKSDDTDNEIKVFERGVSRGIQRGVQV